MTIIFPISFTIELFLVSSAAVILLVILKNYISAHISESTSFFTKVQMSSNSEILKVVTEYNNYNLNKYFNVSSIYNEITNKVSESVNSCKINNESIDVEGLLLSKSIINVSDRFRKEAIGFINYYQQLFNDIYLSKIKKNKLINCNEKFSDFCLHIKAMKPIVFSEGIKKFSKTLEDFEIFLEKYTINLQEIDGLFIYLKDFDIDNLVLRRKLDIGRLVEQHMGMAKHVYNKSTEFLEDLIIKLNIYRTLTTEYLNLLNLYFIICSLKKLNALNHNDKLLFVVNQDEYSELFVKKDLEIRQNYEIIKECQYYLINRNGFYVMHPINLSKLTNTQIKNSYNLENDKNFELNNLIVKEQPILKENGQDIYKLVQKGTIEFKK